jgi:glycolate oxidase
MDWTPDVLDELHALLGADAVLVDEASRFAYDTDSLALERGRPDVVCLPRTTDEAAALVRWAHARGVPVTARGAGTGLAGGATPTRGGMVLSLNRMDQVLEVDAAGRWARVQAGVVNLHLSRQLAPLGLCYAPDPSSQQVSTIGGNVAANAGGPHCLKHGVTSDHLLGLTVVLHDGTVVELGGAAPDAPGLDLAATVAGSEGTLGILTEAWVRLVPLPEAVETLLFDFADPAAACRAVSAVIAAGIVPATLEMMDTVTVTLVEEWLHIGLPTDAGAVLLVEVDGPAASLPAQSERILALAREHGARSTRVARDAAERAALWRGRKSSFGAYGRTGRGFYIMDGVVPRTRLAEALTRIHEMAAARGLDAGNLMHAGDGNLHPHILFDYDDAAQRQAALEMSHEILRMCIAMGGTISGEHGVGLEKVPLMPEMFAPDDLAVMARLRRAFDPDGLLNPGKVLPEAGAGGDAAHAPAERGGAEGAGGGDAASGPAAHGGAGATGGGDAASRPAVHGGAGGAGGGDAASRPAAHGGAGGAGGGAPHADREGPWT